MPLRGVLRCFTGLQLAANRGSLEMLELVRLLTEAGQTSMQHGLGADALGADANVDAVWPGRCRLAKAGKRFNSFTLGSVEWPFGSGEISLSCWS